ncbi:MAG: polysaccharide deacetylase family protein [Bacillota bacterium]|nr:polysaccharide deacetylase family protein [Bacillota bacterium]
MLLILAAGWMAETLGRAPGSGPSPRPAPAARTHRGRDGLRARVPVPAARVAKAGSTAQEAWIPVPILMYHEIGTPPARGWAGLYVSPGAFARQMAYLSASGYHPITMDSWYTDVQEGRMLPSRPVVITFDDGYAGVYRNALPILRRYGFPAVLNLQVGLVGRPGALTLDQVRELAANGFEIDAHTVTHPDLTRVRATTLTRELAGSRQWIRERLGLPARFFAYPSGRYDARVEAAVQAAGFLGAETTVWGVAVPARSGWYTLPRIRVSGMESLATFRDALERAPAWPLRSEQSGAGRGGARTLRGGVPGALRRVAACAPVALLYHDVLADRADRGPLLRDGAIVDRSQFQAEMAWLARSGRPVETVRQFLAAPRPCAVLITFDDGYPGLVTEALPVLEAYHLHATLFLLGGTVGRPGYLSQGQLDELVASGLFDVEAHTFAAHDPSPGHPAFWQMTPAQFQADQQQELALFGRFRLPAPLALAYPHGRPNPRLIPLLAAAGYRAAFTVVPGWLGAGENRWFLPRWTVWPDWPLASLEAAVAGPHRPVAGGAAASPWTERTAPRGRAAPHDAPAHGHASPRPAAGSKV